MSRLVLQFSAAACVSAAIDCLRAIRRRGGVGVCAASAMATMVAVPCHGQWALTSGTSFANIRAADLLIDRIDTVGPQPINWSRNWSGLDGGGVTRSVNATAVTQLSTVALTTQFSLNTSFSGFPGCAAIACNMGAGGSMEQIANFRVNRACLAELRYQSARNSVNGQSFPGQDSVYAAISGPVGESVVTGGEPPQWFQRNPGWWFFGYREVDPPFGWSSGGRVLIVLNPGDYAFYSASGAVQAMAPGSGSLTMNTTASLRVVAPCATVVEQPRSQATCNGSTVELRFGVIGPGPWTFTWYRDGLPVATTSSDREHPFDTLLTGTYYLRDMDPSKVGQYTCIASTPNGFCTTAVSMPATVSLAPICAGACCDRTGSTCTLPGPAGCRSWEEFLPGETCSPNPCQRAYVNCCTPTGCSTNVNLEDCDLAGLMGDCDPAACAEANGACCTPDGGCYLAVVQGSCNAGDTRMLGVVCEPRVNPCRRREPGEPPSWGGPVWRGGACCLGATCAVTISEYACLVASGKFVPGTFACNPLGNTTTPCCSADFNGSGRPPTTQDLFEFLAAWFANDPRADINRLGGLTIQDIFDFLAAYFAGCP